MEETETVLTLADFGALLRERRIHKGLTEENVAAELKITSRLVRSIEEGDMESMPHAVYARGFIRAYAKLLAVDDSVTHAACALLKDPEEELREQEIRVVPAAARREESHVPWLAILLCALFLAGGAWYFRDSIPGLSSNTVSREKTASPAVSSPAVPEADTVVTTPAIPVEPAANATLPAASEEPIVLGGTPLPAETEMPTEQAALPATGHRMLLTAQGDCWVSTTADGKNSQRVMHKGDTLNVDFQEKLVMKLGNAGAMLITYDGKELHGPRFGGRALSGIGPLAAYADAPPRHRIGVCLWRQPEPQTILWLSGSFQRTPDQYQNDPKRHVPFLAGG